MAQVEFQNRDKFVWAANQKLDAELYQKDADYAKMIDGLLGLGVEAVRDNARPCKGNNINICVAEGCFAHACIKDRFQEA